MRQNSFGSRVARWACVGALIVLIPLFVRAAGPVSGGTRVPPPQSVQPEGEPRAADELSFAGTNAAPFATNVGDPEPAKTVLPAGEDLGVEMGVADGQDGIVVFADGTYVAADTPPPALEGTPPPQETQTPEGTWSYENSRIGVSITRHRQDAFTYYAVEIRLTDPIQFMYAFSHEKYGASEEALSDIAARHDPLVAINGDYYSFHNNGIIIRGGKVFRKNKSSRHLLIVDKNGDLRVMTDRSEKQSVVAARLQNEGVLHTFEFGPVLVENGEAVKLNSAILRVGNGYHEPRTAIGQLGPLHYLVLVVDGRSQASEGCDLPTLQRLFLDYGVSVAFNLDGGGSTTLWYDGHVINNPASGDERKVSDIVMFMR